MRPTTKAMVAVASLALAMTALAAPAAASRGPARTEPVYLALGDSWAYGQGASDPASSGYVAVLYEDLRDEFGTGLELLNLGRPATETLPGVTAQLVAREQLPVAVPLLVRRNYDRNPHNDVKTVTLHVGGNDVSGPIQTACLGGFTPECIATWTEEMADFEFDLKIVVFILRFAGGNDLSIVLGTYDNPVPYCQLSGIPGAARLGAAVLEGTPDGSLDGVHDVVRRVADRYGAEVAEIFGELGDGDFVGGEDCLHVTNSGHTAVAEAFLDVIVD